MSRVRALAVPLTLAVALPAGGSVAPGYAARASSTGAALVAAAAAKVRVDQLGYLPREVKRARLMTASPIGQARFRVVDGRGHVVLGRTVPARPVAAWNAQYHAVYVLSFGRVDKARPLPPRGYR